MQKHFIGWPTMNKYLDLAKKILDEGKNKSDRTGTGTRSIFGYQMKFSLKEGFPLLTTKKIYYKALIYELLWFIKGDTNIKYLVENKVRIWNEWPFKKFKKSDYYNNETIDEFIEKIVNDNEFARKFGDLGPVYGKQWRNFNGVDQLKNVINEIKNNPNSRRLIISSWNPEEVDSMALPPCHAFMQFYVNDGEISLHLYQRSADVFLGIPFNIASYSLLLAMVAHVTGLVPKEFIHTLGDAHIYNDHIPLIEKQIKRTPKKIPKLWLNPDVTDIENFKYEDIKILDYDFHPSIKGKVSV